MTTTPPYSVDVRRLQAFSAVELYALLKLRVDVFVVEQACAYPELDGKDGEALHLRLLIDGRTAAYARLWQPAGAPPRVGRVLVSPDHRGKRLGEPVALSAQSHLERFYAGLGFSPTSEEYVEDGIAHIDMERPVSPLSITG